MRGWKELLKSKHSIWKEVVRTFFCGDTVHFPPVGNSCKWRPMIALDRRPIESNPVKTRIIQTCMIHRVSDVTDRGKGGNWEQKPPCSSDVSPFLEMGPLDSASFAFKTVFINLKSLVYTICFLLLQRCLNKALSKGF